MKDQHNQAGLNQSATMPHAHDHHSAEYIGKSLLAGGIAGCAAKTVIAPLDRVKILFQTSNPAYTKYSGKFLGVFTAMREIKATYGPMALFQGHSATLARIFPYAAIKFMSYEQFKIVIMPTKDDQTPLRRLLAGSLAGITSVLASYPLDIIRVRMAFQVKSPTDTASIVRTCRAIYHEIGPFYSSKRLNGLSNFYRGVLPTLYGIIPYAGVSFLTYETLKEHALLTPTLCVNEPKRIDLSSDHMTSSQTLKTWVQLVVGGSSGVIAQTSAYPLEIIRRTMQVAGIDSRSPSNSLGTLGTIKSIYARRGLRGFFVGLSIGYIKVIPMFAISFWVYEYCKGVLEIE